MTQRPHPKDKPNLNANTLTKTKALMPTAAPLLPAPREPTRSPSRARGVLTTAWERHENSLPQVSLRWCRVRHPRGKGALPGPIYKAAWCHPWDGECLTEGRAFWSAGAGFRLGVGSTQFFKLIN